MSLDSAEKITATPLAVFPAEREEETEPPACSQHHGSAFYPHLQGQGAWPPGGAAFHIKPCDVGLGVFASRDIRAGEVILKIWGPIIDFAETKRRGPRECMAIQIGHDRYIDTQAPAVFVNHSCDPNAGIRNDENMVALRNIAAGEEVRFDYSTTMEEQSFTMQCLCGLPECRHVIKDFSTLPQHLKERYLDLRIVMNFIQDAAARNPSRSPATLCAT